MARKQDKQPPKTKKYFRSTKSGAGMTKAGVAKYRRDNPGSKLKTAVTGKVKKGSKAAKRRKSFCARSAGQMKKFPKAAIRTGIATQKIIIVPWLVTSELYSAGETTPKPGTLAPGKASCILKT